MSINSTEPILVKVAQNPADWILVGAALIIIIVAALCIFAFYKPRNIGFKLYKKPDGTYWLKYYWGWHNFGEYYKQHFATLEEAKAQINKILDKTEWKPD